MSPDTLETLRQVNDFLRSARLGLRPERKSCLAIKPRDFYDILGQILRAAECLRHLPPPHSEGAAAVERAMLEYRSNLEELKSFLPGLHVRLLGEKARLGTARAHVATAMDWAQARQKAR